MICAPGKRPAEGVPAKQRAARASSVPPILINTTAGVRNVRKPL